MLLIEVYQTSAVTGLYCAQAQAHPWHLQAEHGRYNLHMSLAVLVCNR
jgi:hypothetical protein